MRVLTMGISAVILVALAAPGAFAQPGPNGKNNYGQCRAYFAGSEEGRANKQAAPPFVALAEVAIDSVVDESCGMMAGCGTDDACECIEANNTCNDVEADCDDPETQCGEAAGCGEGQCECVAENNSCNDTREACEDEICGGDQRDECVADYCPDSNPAGRGKNPSDGSPGQSGSGDEEGETAGASASSKGKGKKNQG